MEQIPPNYMAYDRTIVVFSPDGRLLQVEYARQMVKSGSPSIGIVLKDAVILGAVKISMPLAITESYKKTHTIDDHIALSSSGSLADTRELVEMARVKGQVNKITYSEPISVRSLTEYICDRKHMVTQYAGVRPYGVGLLIGGIDSSGPALYETEPSGTMIKWKAQAIGKEGEKIKTVLNKSYKDGMDLKAGLALMTKAISAGEKKRLTPETFEVTIITKDGVSKISKEELAKFL
ncbi:MAG: archaeal proteasome endopeptidase complex subunit alpha [Candidatus Aenigmatarchaeota archaeon]